MVRRCRRAADSRAHAGRRAPTSRHRRTTTSTWRRLWPCASTHPFDVALAARGRRKQLELRQAEVARAAGVGREWLVDLEHGKPTLELGKVLRTLETLGVTLEVEIGPPPRWTLPYTAEAKARADRLAALRPPSRPRKPRADITPPEDYPLKDQWRR